MTYTALFGWPRGRYDRVHNRRWRAVGVTKGVKMMKLQRHKGDTRRWAGPRSLLLAFVLTVTLLSGCGAPDSPAMGGTLAPSTGGRDVPLQAERFTVSEDVEMDHFVGAVDDDLFIGVAVSPQAAGAESARTVAVHLCDSAENSRWIFDDVAGQSGTLTAEDATVEMTLADDGVSGTVAMDDREPQSFTAEPAADNAGIYRAVYHLGGVDHNIDWIVLADGRQRGPLDGKGNDVPPPPPLVLR